MKKSAFFAFCFAVLAAANIFAQRQVPTPVSAAEREMRDGSIRLRSMDLERVKRDANKPIERESGKEQAIRFTMVKNDFENIQKNQDSIIKAYTTGKEINYERISDGAHDIKKQAHRLGVNLFFEDFENADSEKKVGSGKQKSVRDLFIELDNTLGVFVTNPVFKDIKIVDPSSSEKARLDLKKIYILSDELFKAASKMK